MFDVLATSSSPLPRHQGPRRRHPLLALVCCLKHTSRSRPSRGYVATCIPSVRSSVSLSPRVGVPQLLHNSPDAVYCYSPILAVTEAATTGIRSTRTTTPTFGSGAGDMLLSNVGAVSGRPHLKHASSASSGPPQDLFSDARTHGYQGPTRHVRLSRVTGGGNAAIAKSEDGVRCAVAGRECEYSLERDKPHLR